MNNPMNTNMDKNWYRIVRVK